MSSPVVVPDGVTEIEGGGYFAGGAFRSCDSLTAVTLPEGVKNIGDMAFAWCSNLASVILPKSLTSIGEWAFADCKSLTSISLPDNILTVGSGAFSDCGNIEIDVPGTTGNRPENFEIENGSLVKYTGIGGNVIVPNGVTKIGGDAFKNCSSLTSVTLPKGVTSIGDSAFYGCGNLMSIDLPESVTSIADHAFSGCKRLMSIKIPESLNSIGDWAFSDCTALADKDGFLIVGGVLFAYFGTGGNVIVPEGVTEIRDRAFEKCGELTEITFPDSLRTVSAYALHGCDRIEIHISDAAANRPENFAIQNGVLKSYEGVGGNVVVPAEVTRIEEEAFEYCRCLTRVQLPEGLTSIGGSAFKNCGNLLSVNLPDSIREIGRRAFSGCKRVKFKVSDQAANRPDNFVIQNGVLEKYKGPGGNVVVPDGVKEIKGEANWSVGAFFCCTSLTSITLPEGLTSIGNDAFRDCKNLERITLPTSLKRIGNYAFGNCERLVSIEFGQSTAQLTGNVFGDDCPEGLADQTAELYPHMADGALKQYVLKKETWKNIDSALRAEIFLARQGKSLEPAYAECVESEELKALGEALLKQLEADKPGAKDCAAAATYMTLFHENAPIGTLKCLYEKLKQIKAGAKAVKAVEAHVALMDKLGSAVAVDNSLTPAAQKTMAVMISEKQNTKDLEKTLKEYYSLTFKDLPVLRASDGKEVEPMVFAWLLTAHESLNNRGWGQPDVSAEYEMPGLRPEAEEIVSLLDIETLQNALLKLADSNLGLSGRSKKMYLAYPICRYADESLMAELTARAPKWRSSVSGNDAPPLAAFRDAAKYSETRAAMLFAEQFHELNAYAKIRGADADTIRDKYLSDVGLDEQKGKVYDLGNQTVTARLQKDLSFVIELPSGKTAKSLPKKGADLAKFEAANKNFTEMKKSVKKILKNRGKVLFEDFLSGRERPSADWQDAYLHNPLLREAASLVVWAQGKQTFTLAETGPIDSAEQPYAFTEQPLTVAHPLEMKPNEVIAWQKYITRHGLKQPFAQMWEPVRKSEEIAKDRYAGCMIPYYRFVGQEKHGIHVTDEDYHNEITIEIDGCDTDIERIDWQRHAIDMNDCFEVKSFGFKKYTRQVNHIVAYLDRVTVWDRVRKDDLTVMDLMPGFTLAQITEFIAAAQEANATNVLAELLNYKNANFADFDPMDEFTLEW